MNFPEELLSNKYASHASGDTRIIIETNHFLIKLGSNDLGAWLEKINKKMIF